MAGAMSGISTHVLDLALGRPAVGVHVRLEREEGGVFRELARGVTDADGRVKSLLPVEEPPQAGRFRLSFETGAYFRAQGSGSFHPCIEITFEVQDTGEHYHVPLLVTPHSYSTYRGS
jgi:5-hydroxyisourate hydrolase